MRIIYIFIIIIFLKSNLYSQCACMGGAAIGGLTAIGGTANIGVLKQGYLRTNLTGIYLYGNKFFGERSIEHGVVNYFETIYTNLSIGAGITNDLMFEADLGLFPKKTQSYTERDLDTLLQSDGLSHIGITAKYNFYNSIMKELELTVGSGLRVPFQTDDNNLPQHVSSSTGAYGLNLQLFFHKGFKKQDLHLFLITRYDYNFENERNYHYGSSLNTSFFVTKKLIENLSAYLEFRNEFRDFDLIDDKRNDNSGGVYWIISPQINYSFYKMNFSVYFNYPIHQDLNGSQLGLNYSLGMNLTWQSRIF